MTNHATGHTAEEYAEKYLKKLGYEIVARNWKNRVCEIDIVAKKDERIYCFEVKYRFDTSQGSGFEYITNRKLDQMEFAARNWITDIDWSGDYALGAIELTGPDFEVTEFLSDLS